jgi:hypothetical protein
MRHLRLLGLALAALLVTAGIAVAAHRAAASETDPVAATFTAERTSVDETTCTGSDGTYRDARETFRGTITSTDPRLAGELVLRTKSLINQTTGNGTTRGKVWVLDADDDVIARGELTAVNTSLGVLNGLVTGKVDGGGRVVANFTATFSSATALAGELGGGAAQNTAVIQTGGCDHGRGKGRGHGHG